MTWNTISTVRNDLSVLVVLRILNDNPRNSRINSPIINKYIFAHYVHTYTHMYIYYFGISKYHKPLIKVNFIMFLLIWYNLSVRSVWRSSDIRLSSGVPRLDDVQSQLGVVVIQDFTELISIWKMGKGSKRMKKVIVTNTRVQKVNLLVP